jgi:hypothetical protein
MNSEGPKISYIELWLFTKLKFTKYKKIIFFCSGFRLSPEKVFVVRRISFYMSVSQSSQYVLVSSPIWDFWPEIFFFFFWKLLSVLSFGGALSDERSGLSFVSLLSI